MHYYTEEERKFLKKYVPGHSHKDITKAFNKKFHVSLSEEQIKSYINRHKISTGRTGRFEKGNIPHNKGKKMKTTGRMAETQFKKGNLPHNTKPIGYERKTRDGYIEVKIKMRPSGPNKNDNFVPKQRLVYEEHYGPVPEGHIIVFVDGNKENFDIENLRCISRAEHSLMNKLNLNYGNKEFYDTGVLIARHMLMINRKKK